MRTFNKTDGWIAANRGVALLERALVRNLREANKVRGTLHEALFREQCTQAARLLPVVGREAMHAAAEARSRRIVTL
jgi:hypothetical protein